MGLIYNSLQKIFNSKPLQKYKEAVRKEFLHLLSPITQEQQELKSNILQLHEKINQSEQQTKQLKKILTDFQAECPKKINEIVRYHKINNPHHDNFIQKIENLKCIEEDDDLKKLFTNVIGRFFPKDMAVVTQYQDFIFSEILKMYLFPGGIWELNKLLVNLSNADHPRASHPLEKENTQNQQVSRRDPLKLLFVCGMFPSLEHGGGGRIFDIISELSKSHEIDLFSVFNKELDQFSLDLLKDKIQNFELVTLRDLTVESLREWLKQIKKNFNDYDVIQLEYHHTIPLINDLRKYTATKIGFTFMECCTKSFAISIHNAIKAQNFDNISELCLTFWDYVAKEKQSLDSVDFRIAMTPEDVEVLHKLSPDKKIHIIPTCISKYAILDEYERHKESIYEKYSVAYLGYFNHFPNVDSMEWYLKEIHPVVKENVPGYKFYIIGRGDTSSLQELAQNDESVIFTGRVDSIVPNILKSQICISPLISGAGIRGKQNQYSVLGKPSVTTTIGNKGLKYVDGESVIIADNASDFANGIVRLLTDGQFYNKIKKNAQQIAKENYTWKSQITKLVNVYRCSN